MLIHLKKHVQNCNAVGNQCGATFYGVNYGPCCGGVPCVSNVCSWMIYKLNWIY